MYKYLVDSKTNDTDNYEYILKRSIWVDDDLKQLIQTYKLIFR